MTGLNTKADAYTVQALARLETIEVNTAPLAGLAVAIENLDSSVQVLNLSVQAMTAAVAVLPSIYQLLVPLAEHVFETYLLADGIKVNTDAMVNVPGQTLVIDDIVRAIMQLSSVMKALNCCADAPPVVLEPPALPAPTEPPDVICRAIQYSIERGLVFFGDMVRHITVADNVSVTIVNSALLGAGIPTLGATLLATALVNSAAVIRTTGLYPLIASEFERISVDMRQAIYDNSQNVQAMKAAVNDVIWLADIALPLKVIYQAFWSIDRLNAIAGGGHGWNLGAYEDVCSPWQYQTLFQLENTYFEFPLLEPGVRTTIISEMTARYAAECRFTLSDVGWGAYRVESNGDRVGIMMTAFWWVTCYNLLDGSIIQQFTGTAPTSYGGEDNLTYDAVYPAGIGVRLDIELIGAPVENAVIGVNMRLAGHVR